jgi:hypothetical protein
VFEITSISVIAKDCQIAVQSHSFEDIQLADSTLNLVTANPLFIC